MPNLMWTYKGLDIYHADTNSSGINWETRISVGTAARGHENVNARADHNHHGQ